MLNLLTEKLVGSFDIKKQKTMSTIYISGQMTGLTEREYRKKFKNAEEHLKKAGWKTIDPSKIMAGNHIDRAELLWIDLKTLMECDAVYMLNNWTESLGATAEYHFAKAIGKQILFEAEEK